MTTPPAEAKGGDLFWYAPNPLSSNLYALARNAGFKWQKGKKCWKAKDTAEGRQFLKDQDSELTEIAGPPFRTTTKAEAAGAPELMDFRVSAQRKQLILFLREGEAFYRKHIDLTVEGAGLYAIGYGAKTATFSRHGRSLKYDKATEAAYLTRLDNKFVVVGVSREMAALLALALWGRPIDPTKWTVWEDVQPAHHLNAAD